MAYADALKCFKGVEFPSKNRDFLRDSQFFPVPREMRWSFRLNVLMMGPPGAGKSRRTARLHTIRALQAAARDPAGTVSAGCFAVYVHR